MVLLVLVVSSIHFAEIEEHKKVLFVLLVRYLVPVVLQVVAPGGAVRRVSWCCYSMYACRRIGTCSNSTGTSQIVVEIPRCRVLYHHLFARALRHLNTGPQ
jgi:hypothetical protein